MSSFWGLILSIAVISTIERRSRSAEDMHKVDGPFFAAIFLTPVILFLLLLPLQQGLITVPAELIIVVVMLVWILTPLLFFRYLAKLSWLRSASYTAIYVIPSLVAELFRKSFFEISPQ